MESPDRGEADEAEKNFDRDSSKANLIALNKGNAALVHALSLESEYWSCWDFINNDIQEAVRDFFCGTPMPRSFKATTIVLIPKVESPQTWNDFRPISLCNVTNKIMSKLLYKKLSHSLPNLISAQSGFVTGRHVLLDEMRGQQINQAKSAFVPGRKANLIANRIKNITGFSMKALPITYLGAPLYKGNKRKVLYENLIDKVRNRISGWNTAPILWGSPTTH
ncbi:hypothetical protein Sango_2938600 [Sesamum angolense]|uniref:Reverse transcriptase domain-containing protein n=1 Tax=Sesamum angolense TaxID=2727404 RepID=A0AAE1T534_9LAMI|nr:hypothetical protein Sango_2938600 [Sesamum angolense]